MPTKYRTKVNERVRRLNWAIEDARRTGDRDDRLELQVALVEATTAVDAYDEGLVCPSPIAFRRS